MWLDIVMFCMTPTEASTCSLTVNNEKLDSNKQNCRKEMRSMEDNFVSRGIFAQGMCIEIGV